MNKELTPLEALKRIGKLEVNGLRVKPVKTIVSDYDNYFIIEKSLKALEIIKEKRVDVKDLMNEFEWTDALKSYNERTNHIPLTQEEFDLLKEVLK